MVKHNSVTKNTYRNNEQELTHLNVDCYISDLGHFIEKYIVISVYKNYQNLLSKFTFVLYRKCSRKCVINQNQPYTHVLLS